MHRPAPLGLALLVFLARPVSAGVERWTTAGPSSPEIEQIVVDGTFPGTLYTVADHRLFKSLDGGSDWRSIAPAQGTDDDDVHSVAVDPTRSTTLFAGTSFGLARSDDGGLSWTGFFEIASGQSSRILEIAPSHSGSLYFRTDDAFYASDDGGDHIRALAGPWPAGSRTTALAVDPSAPATLYGGVADSGVFRSVDAGVRWSSMGPGLSTAPIQIVIDPETPTTVYAVTEGGGLYTIVYGSRVWYPIGPPGHAVVAVAIESVGSSTLFAAADGVYESSDRGATWSRHSVGPPIVAAAVSIRALAVTPGEAVLYAGSSEDGLYRSGDGGTTWDSRNFGLPGLSTGVIAVTPSLPAVIYAAGASRIFRRRAIDYWEVIGSMSALALAADPSGSAVYAGTGYCVARPSSCSGGLYRISDDEDSPTLLLEGAIFAIAVSPSSPETIYASRETLSSSGYALGTVLRSIDGGASWTDVGIPESFLAFKLLVDPVQPGHVFATDGWRIFHSLDGGASWLASINDFQLVPVQDLAMGSGAGAPIYAATLGGMYRSSDGGVAWDLVLGAVTAVAVDPRDPQVVYAVSLDRVLRSSDAGVLWRLMGPGLPGSPVYGLALDRTGATVYAGTLHGVYDFEFRTTRIQPVRPAEGAVGARSLR